MPTTGSRPIPIADPSRTCTYRGQYMITATPARQTAPPNRYGMISDNLVRKLLDWIKEGRRTPQQATKYLARFCICGVFNTARAEKLFEKARTATP